jgi:hypothetical protein
MCISHTALLDICSFYWYLGRSQIACQDRKVAGMGVVHLV